MKHFNSIFKVGIFGKTDKKKNAAKRASVNDASYASTDTSYISSDNDSIPATPSNGSVQECRGIFRTLEPVWYYKSSLLNNDQDINEYQWIPFNDETQSQLEIGLTSKNTHCIVKQEEFGICTIVYDCNLRSNNQQTRTNQGQHTLTIKAAGPVYHMGKEIRRTITPIWWFEDDYSDGTKGMCRFEHKNQIRLEALSDGRNNLVLTDAAFNVPLNAVLERSNNSNVRDELHGFMYLEYIPSGFQFSNEDTCYPQNIPMTEDKDHDLTSYFQDENTSYIRRYSV